MAGGGDVGGRGAWEVRGFVMQADMCSAGRRVSLIVGEVELAGGSVGWGVVERVGACLVACGMMFEEWSRSPRGCTKSCDIWGRV